MQNKIIHFLAREKIVRLSEREVNQELAKRVGAEEARSLNRRRYGLGEEIDEMPQFYDLYQNFEGFYDIRAGFLMHMVKIIEGHPNKTGLTIIDGGCATGLDACFLALEYPHNNFRGYDNQEGSVALADKRKTKLGLKNIQFKVADHLAPTPEEVATADILISKMCSCDEEGTVDSTARVILKSAPRLKKNGLYVFAACMAGNVTPLANRLDWSGFKFISTQRIASSQTHGSVYDHLFRYERG